MRIPITRWFFVLSSLMLLLAFPPAWAEPEPIGPVLTFKYEGSAAKKGFYERVSGKTENGALDLRLIAYDENGKEIKDMWSSDCDGVTQFKVTGQVDGRKVDLGITFHSLPSENGGPLTQGGVKVILTRIQGQIGSDKVMMEIVDLNGNLTLVGRLDGPKLVLSLRKSKPSSFPSITQYVFQGLDNCNKVETKVYLGVGDYTTDKVFVVGTSPYTPNSIVYLLALRPFILN